jgi:hypothetical protein
VAEWTQFLRSSRGCLMTADEAAKGRVMLLKSFVMLKLLDRTLEVVSVQPATSLVVLLALAKYS